MAARPFDPTDSHNLTPEQRLDELAALLAIGVRRTLEIRAKVTLPDDVESSSDSHRIALMSWRKRGSMSRVVNASESPRKELLMTHTTGNIEQTIAALCRMTVGQLRNKYQEVFGEPTRSGNDGIGDRRVTARHFARDAAKGADRSG